MPPTRRYRLLPAVAIAATAVLAVIPAGGAWDVYGVRFVGLMVSVALWALAAMLGGVRRPERSDWPFLGSLAAFGVAIVVSTTLSYAPLELLTFGNGYYGGAVMWLAFLLVAGLASLVRPEGELRAGMLIAQIPVAVVVLVAGFQVFFADRVNGVFDNSNHLVPGLLLIAPVCLALARTQSGWSRNASIVLAVATWLVLLRSGSSAGAGAVVLEVALLAWLAPSLLGLQAGKAIRRARIAATSVVAGVAVFAVVALAVPGVLPQGLRTVVQTQVFGESLSTRVYLWGLATGSLQESPVFGLGADGYEAFVQQTMRETVASTGLMKAFHEQSPVAQDPHNLVLLVTSSFGLLGLLLGALAAVLWLRSALLLLATGQGRTQRLAFLIGVAGWAAAMLLLPLSVQWGAFPAMMIGLSIVRAAREDRPPSTVAVWAGRVAGGVVVLAALVLGGSALAGIANFAAADSARAAGVVAKLEAARAVQPTMSYYEFLLLDARGRALGKGAADVAAYQKAVDEAGPAIAGDARYRVLLLRNSLDQAFLSGRTDLTWERAELAKLESMAPGLPEVRIERIHLDLLDGDLEAGLNGLLALEPYASSFKRYGLYRYYYALFAGREDVLPALRAAALSGGDDIERLMTGPRRSEQ